MNKENWVRARSNIIFILALAVGFGLVTWIERNSVPPMANAATGTSAIHEAITYSQNLPAQPNPRSLTDQERKWAKIAWQYFENNTHPQTGLANSVDKYQAATMWDTASYLLALVSALKIELITRKEFDARLSQALDSLGKLPLYNATLPNKSYHIGTLAMVDYGGNPTQNGIGWSAIDVGRLIVPLSVIAWNYPDHTAAARRVAARWQLPALMRNGVLHGMHSVDGKQPQLLQEGRLGYEQYAAKAVGLLGLIAAEALNYQAQLQYAKIYGIAVPHDKRDEQSGGGHNYVVSEPYMLDGLEFGWDQISREFAWRVFAAQEARFKQSGVLTAVTEDHLDQAPYFVYNTVFSNGKPWSTLTEDGKDASSLRTLSVKAAFAWHALYRTPYTEKLVENVADLFDAERGWYAGRYEENSNPNKAITANTNGIVLESLAYIATGKLLSFAQEEKL